MNKKPVSVNIDNNFYKKGLVSLLNELPWIELVPPDHPTVEVVFTDQPRHRSKRAAVVFVADCSNQIDPTWLNLYMGAICASEISQSNLVTCMSQVTHQIKYFSPLAQQQQLKLQLRRSIGDQYMEVLRVLLSNPAVTLDEQAAMLNISRATLSSRFQELYSIFQSKNKTELVVKVYQAGLATC